MRKHTLFLLLNVFCLSVGNAETTNVNENQSRHGIHGMLLFSDGEQLYASHLPMFHKPHDVQIIMAVNVEDQTLNSQLVSQLAKGDYWTLEPERFDLSKLGTNQPDAIHSFTADIYANHFERGGTKEYEGKQLIVTKTVFLQTLSEQPAKNATFFLVNEKERSTLYYFHAIKGRPDFDALVEIQHAAFGKRTIPTEFDIPKRQDFATLQEIANALAIPKDAMRLVYFETGDLK
ncbi:hypothetical protein NI389_17560 (plasmid) [Pseudoalteromonas xiamenensis]|uniref:hypothetical protein n=1 Tax=Pseudoalteromonas xiamenensis TaxID=882626 RepID=UPI0027E5223F|nr:hypothetical protein [Pseudoalteromonas xiamenensis]WMN61623.1 hypothetical protein NI389_17560 [Pseudoalteromonas xiamenensis]